MSKKNNGNSGSGRPVPKGTSFRPWMLLPFASILMMICVVVGFLYFRTPVLMGVVQKTEWQRVIVIEAQSQVNGQDWRDQLPTGAEILACQPKYRRQEKPVAGATQVCATPIGGHGPACLYEAPMDYCSYQALVWQSVDRAQSQGSDLKPYWPTIVPAGNQRAGARSETYTIYFQTTDGIKQFTTSDAGFYARFLPASEWLLSLDKKGAILDVSLPE